nr:PREDICTED: SLAM family member 5-like [Latimeria chalumnae]|eukprot:XP_014345905.1 PREDICTED: SLAM family member 5-like [Latimeria chalumnae]
MEDKGDYKVQLVMEQNQTTIFYNLQVYEHVSTPVRVVNTSSASHSGTCNVTLNCSVETGSQVQYSWSSEDGAVRDVFQHLSVSGAVLHLTLKPEDYSKSITCTASNPVSKESASVTLWSYCNTALKGDSCCLSYCNVKGIMTGIVLPLLITAIVTCHYVDREK